MIFYGNNTAIDSLLFPTKLSINLTNTFFLMRKFLLLLFAAILSLSVGAQCLGDDCSIKGRNKAAKSKTKKLTGKAKSGSTYAKRKSPGKRGGSSAGFDPFAGGGGSKKQSSQGYDPFENNDAKGFKKNLGKAYDPYDTKKKKSRGGKNQGYADWDGPSGGKRKSASTRGLSDGMGDGRKRGVSRGGVSEGWADGSRRKSVASGGTWNEGFKASGKSGRGKANDSWADSGSGKRGSSSEGRGGGFSEGGKKGSASGGRGGFGNEGSRGGSAAKGYNRWDNNTFAVSESLAPPSYAIEDNTPKSYSQFESTNISTDLSYDQPHFFKYEVIAGEFYTKSSDQVVENHLAKFKRRPVFGAEIGLEYPTNGSKNYHHFFNVPTVGVGLTYLNLGNDAKLGSILALYPYANIPIFRTKALDFNFNIGVGACYANKYDMSSPTDSVLQTPIFSSPINVYFKGGFNFELRPFMKFKDDKGERRSHYSFIAGVNWAHMSNASFYSPNSGLNLTNASVGIKYMTAQNFKYALRQNADNLPNLFSLDMMVSGGGRQMTHLDTRLYGVGNINLAVYFQALNAYRIGLGVDGFYDEAFAEDHSSYNPTSNTYEGTRYSTLTYDRTAIESRFRAGACLSNEFVMGRVTAAVDAGYYFFDPIKAPNEEWYYRLGLKYRVTNRFFTGVSVKTHEFTRAEFVTLGFGYSILL